MIYPPSCLKGISKHIIGFGYAVPQVEMGIPILYAIDFINISNVVCLILSMSRNSISVCCHEISGIAKLTCREAIVVLQVA